MVGRTCSVLAVMCWVLFQVAQARILEEKSTGNDGMIRPTLPPNADSDEEETSHDQISLPKNRFDEISEGLYGGDIVLTQEQKRLLQERKAIDPALYWPKNNNGKVIVGYRFGDTIINKTLVKVAITHWETHTCIRFKEVTPSNPNVHLNFIDADHCASHLGRVASMNTGQPVWLSASCVSEVGPAVHEIGHALGFNHEQERSDRDDHVQIMWNNIQDGKETNFNKQVTFNYGVPYDYSSVMHSGPNYFTRKGSDTLVALNPMAKYVMGNRIGLSFADKRMANTMYGCLGKWLTQCSLSSNPCKNMGYTGPACSCVCPEGTSGSLCEVLVDSYTAALIKLRTPYSESITKPGTVSTPGYPTPIQTRTEFVKVLVAPYCYKVKLTILDFEVYLRDPYDTCDTDALNVRTQDALGTGVQYCGSEITPGTVFISGNNTIVLDYYNYDYTLLTSSNSYRGFNATVEHILDDGCTPTTTTPNTTTPTTTTPTTTTPTTTTPTTTTPTTTTRTTTTPTTTTPTTTTPTGPAVTIINSGSIPLTVSSSRGNCTLNSTSTSGSYTWTSARYPSKYLQRDYCHINITTSEPRYIIVDATSILISAGDIISMTSAFGKSSSIDSRGVGRKHLLISSSSNISFTPTSKTLGKSFLLGLEVYNSYCHQIIKLKAGANGTLSKTNYAANTVCEWWIQAPIGRKVQLAFSTFNVGVAGCADDFLGIDISGDPFYMTNAKIYCVTNSPKTVTSSGSQMNVLLRGIQGGYPGFTATYSVV